MHARTLRYHANVSRQFRDSSRRFGESIRKPIANSSHPSEIGAYDLETWHAASGTQALQLCINDVSISRQI